MLRTMTTAACIMAAAAALWSQTPATSRPAQRVQKPAARPAVKKDTPASLEKEAKVPMKTARKTALKEVPNGRIRTAKLERESGKLVYSFNIKLAGKSGSEQVIIDAMTGAVVGHEHELPRPENKAPASPAKK